MKYSHRREAKMASKSRRKATGILEQYRTSGLSQREFADREGVSASTLAYWLRRERLERQARGKTALVAVAPVPCSRSAFVLERDGLRIEVPRDVSAEEWRVLLEAWGS
ncbi:MAG: hypothetical protein AB7O52_05650 [Planctomycetota bacterium]